MTSAVWIATLAQHRDGWWGDHMSGWGGGWVWLWGTLMVLAWVALIGTAVWLVARALGPGRAGRSRAREILDERYARGELTTEEYQERLERLG
ncbi:MAG: SHOCT domain-containing protein [Acidimicrobiia bacterium]